MVDYPVLNRAVGLKVIGGLAYFCLRLGMESM
jgi:hypothetical protein